jgi:tetratricopeptide (TPR) repeat protein
MSEHFISRADAESDLLSCAAYISESIDSSDGHAEGMLSVVPQYLAKGNVDLAAELANTVDDPFTRDRLLILVAEKCTELKDDEYAIQLIDSLEDPGLQAEGRERLGIMLSSTGDLDGARTIALTMHHPDYVLSAVAAKEYANGDTDSAGTTIAGIDFAGARIAALTSIVHAGLAENKTEGLSQLLLQAAENAVLIEHNEEKIRSYIEIGTLFTDIEDNANAIETFSQARDLADELDNIHRDAFLAGVSVGFLRAGSQDLADRTLDQVTDKTQLATCLVGHARHYWAADQNDDAVEAIEEAYAILRSQHEKETRNSKEKFKLFGSIAAQFALFDKGERAIEAAEKIEDDNESQAALAQLATILIARGHNDLAERALNAIAEDAQRVFALIGMSDASEILGERSVAVSRLNEAVSLTETVPQIASRATAYAEIAKRFGKYDEADGFDAAVAKQIEAITAIKDESIKVTSLVELSLLIDEMKLTIPPEDLEFLKVLLKDIPAD